MCSMKYLLFLIIFLGLTPFDHAHAKADKKATYSSSKNKKKSQKKRRRKMSPFDLRDLTKNNPFVEVPSGGTSKVDQEGTNP